MGQEISLQQRSRVALIRFGAWVGESSAAGGADECRVRERARTTEHPRHVGTSPGASLPRFLHPFVTHWLPAARPTPRASRAGQEAASSVWKPTECWCCSRVGWWDRNCCWELAVRHAVGALCDFCGGIPKNGAFCNPRGPLPKLSWQNPSKISGNEVFLTGDWINGNHSRWVLLTGLLVWGFLQGGLGEPQTLQGTWGGILTLKKGQS